VQVGEYFEVLQRVRERIGNLTAEELKCADVFGIYGKGKTARAVKEFLDKKGIRSFMFDDSDWGKKGLEEILANLKHVEWLVVSPGVPPIKVLELFKKKSLKTVMDGVKVLGDIDLVWGFKKGYYAAAVTGSKGKTTVTTMIAHILGKVAVGNVGIPPARVCSEVDRNLEDLVLEVSSFQLEYNTNFKVKVGCILNLWEDHLDRYGNLDTYWRIKSELVLHSDVIVIGEKDLEKLLKFFDVDENKLVVVGRDYIRQERKFYRRGNLLGEFDNEKIFGFRLDNVLYAWAVVDQFGMSWNEFCKQLRSYEFLPHRLEFVVECNGIVWVNDSKSTSTDSTVAAFYSYYPKKNVILIWGGYDKKLDWTPVEKLPAKVSIVTGDLAKVDVEADYRFVKLEDAIRKANELAEPGDVVLFSPATSSYDRFKSYEERGEFFKRFVKIEVCEQGT